MRFSERNGYRPVLDRIQVESINDGLRNGLWNLLTMLVWSGVTDPKENFNLLKSDNRRFKWLLNSLWHSYFKRPIDQISDHWKDVQKELRGYFFSCPWFEVYDFLEFIHDHHEAYEFKERFSSVCNSLLERESSAYRFVNGKIGAITDSTEIAKIESALCDSPAPVKAHLDRALELLTSRDSPDYRNSVKESISAVESFVSVTLGNEKGTLGQMLKKLEENGRLHPALKTAFSSLYGYTSDQGGVRHALQDKDSVTNADAKFMLITCSAFINYVRQSSSP